MIIKNIAAVVVLFSMLNGFASADTVKIPVKKPVVSIDIPGSWKPEETDKGYSCESPDQIATVFFEVTSAKGLDDLISENIDWLVKDQGVKIDKASEKKGDFKNGGLDWSKISWDGDNKEFGPATVGFMFTAVGNGKVLTVTYWITKKGAEKQSEALTKLLDSVKPVE